MIVALVLTSLIESLGLGPKPLACVFPPAEGQSAPIEISMTSRPSLKDMPGLYRVDMSVNGAARIKGAAQPITTTKGRDVMVRARAETNLFYTVGIDERGAAALNIMDISDPDTRPKEWTRTGRCRNHERYIDRWLTY